MYTKYNYTSHDTILYQLPPDNNNQIFNCGNENYTEIIIERGFGTKQQRCRLTYYQ